jgi:hypothetical protein
VIKNDVTISRGRNNPLEKGFRFEYTTITKLSESEIEFIEEDGWFAMNLDEQ